MAPEYATWRYLLTRASGKIPKRWKSFYSFLADVGSRPGPGFRFSLEARGWMERGLPGGVSGATARHKMVSKGQYPCAIYNCTVPTDPGRSQCARHLALASARQQRYMEKKK